VWLRKDGTKVILSSGKGTEWYDAAVGFARRRGWIPLNLPPHATIDFAKHIEVQLAIRMRSEMLTDETVVIDRPVCGRGEVDRTWLLTCDRLLPEYLPPGVTLRIVDCNGFELTYQGRSDD
jgi:hypothetical protein